MRRSRLISLVLLSATAFVAVKSHAQDATTFEFAVEQVKSGNGHEAISTPEALARNGDSRAQFLLSVALLEGRLIEQDKAQGYAWLKVLTTPYRGSLFHAVTSARASDVASKVASSLSETDLIRADQIVSNYVTGRNAGWDESFQRAKDAFATGLNGGEGPLDKVFLFAAGCAADRTLSGCDRISKAEAAKPHCTGNTVAPDVSATTQGTGTHITRPVYPGKMSMFDGEVGIRAHLDSSGWVCFAKVSDSSGNPKTDRAAMDAATRWRLIPAFKDGVAVESFFTWYITLKSQ